MTSIVLWSRVEVRCVANPRQERVYDGRIQVDACTTLVVVTPLARSVEDRLVQSIAAQSTYINGKIVRATCDTLVVEASAWRTPVASESGKFFGRIETEKTEFWPVTITCIGPVVREVWR